MPETLTLPGFVNAHTHTFQRALRGRAAGSDFWEWRDGMLREAEGQSPGQVRATYAAAYGEMRAAGYTAVGEFHYLGLEEARAAADAAAEAGVELVLLLAAYARGGLPRMRQASVADYLGQVEALRDEGLRVGVAPHSVRACPRDWLEEIGAYAVEQGLPLHVHADEQPREVEECIAEHGCRPIELLARTGCLGPHATIVHATQADGAELDLLAEAGAAICACPTTEADLARRLPRRPRASSTGASRSASAPTRTSASIRSRSCARSRASRAVRPAAAGCSAPSGCSLRRGRGRALPGARLLARGRGRPRPPVARRRHRGGRAGRARRRLLRRRPQGMITPCGPPRNRNDQYAVRSRYAPLRGGPLVPHAPS